MSNSKVLFLSTWFRNPYKSLLISSLETQKVQVQRASVSRVFVLQIFGRTKPEVLHFHALPFPVIWKNPVAQFLKLYLFRIQIQILHLFGVKIVWTAHEWHGKINLKNVEYTPTLFANLIGKSIDAIITHCETTKQEIATTWKLKQENKIFVVPHGNYIDWYTNKITPVEAKKSLDLPVDNMVFLIFGNIAPYKGILEAIEAFKCLPQKNISLLIVGQCKYNDLLNLIKHNIEGYQNIVCVSEKVPDDDVQIYMNACDCLVLPYKVFTTSGAAVLGMSFGRACIAPNSGFFRDILDESGSFLYDINQEESLLQAMKSSIQNRTNLPQMGAHNLELAKKWNWQYVAQETLKVYQSL